MKVKKNQTFWIKGRKLKAGEEIPANIVFDLPVMTKEQAEKKAEKSFSKKKLNY